MNSWLSCGMELLWKNQRQTIRRDIISPAS